MRFRRFLKRHPVFTVNELDIYLEQTGSSNRNTRNSLLRHHKKAGRIIPIRRGVYATVPWGIDSERLVLDPYLVASKLTEDAVLAYHTAMEFHGRAYTVHWRSVYVSAKPSSPLVFQSHEYRCAPVPPPLKAKRKSMFGVNVVDYLGSRLAVTSHERTLVDLFDRPDLAGGWEEVWRSLESVEFFYLDAVVAYAQMLENASTAAKVGFFLQTHRDSLSVDDIYLQGLRELSPRQPHYMSPRSEEKCKLVKDWNLMVPIQILDRSWEEVV